MNMLNRNCKTSFVKPEFLKKAQRVNPRLYDIGCYNDNLALMLAPEYDDLIHIAQESRSKLITNLQCDYLEQIEKCDRLEKELSKRSKNVNNKAFNELSKRFSALEQHSINFELALQQRQENLNNESVCKEKDSTSFRELNVKYFEIQDLKAHLRDKNIAMSELKKLIEKLKGKFLIKIILFIIDSGCSKHMTGNLKLLSNFVEKFLGTVKFRNDQIAPILGYGDLVQGNITIKRVYYVKGLNQNLFSNDTSTPNPICLMAKATSSQACLWHRRLSHMNFDTINLLSKNDIVTSLPKLKFVKDHLCSSCKLGKAKRLHAQVRTVKTDKGTKFLNKTLHEYFAKEGYSTQSKTYRVYNMRTRVIIETIHVNFDELPHMASDQISSDPILKCQTMALEQDSLSPIPRSQENVPQTEKTVTTSNELDFLFSPMFDELFNGSSKVVSKFSVGPAADARNNCQQQNTIPSTSTNVDDGSSKVVSKSSAVLAADARNNHQQQNTTSSTSTTIDAPASQAPIHAPTVTITENINQAETQVENVQVE
ncbi:integrase, catalytic region, zinc finger, CCHC-type containing protein [Tanacetum coccineum]